MSVVDWSRRGFLRTMGLSVPVLKLVPQSPSAQREGAAGVAADTRFTPVDLTVYFTASSVNVGPRELAKLRGAESAKDGLIRTPGGQRQLRGIPFKLGPAEVQRKSWVVLTTRPIPWAAPELRIPLAQNAGFVCFAWFCDWDPQEVPPLELDVYEQVGQHLADVTMIFDDGEERTYLVRRRFEVSAPAVVFGHLPFAAVSHRQDEPSHLTDPLKNGTDWGPLQRGIWEGTYAGAPWLCTLVNPFPERPLRALRLRARSEDLLAVCGITLCHGTGDPLRYDRSTLYRITLPDELVDEDRWQVNVDLGVVIRTVSQSDFDGETWLRSPRAGLGDPADRSRARALYATVAASTDATLCLRDLKTGRRFDFDLASAAGGQEVSGVPAGAVVQLVEREKVWLHGQVVDARSGHPTPARLAFRSKDGRYIPPYGHRTEINTGWFQDYGADVKLHDSSFAYVDGTFQVELPAGEVYLEVVKGFEFEPVRRKLMITPEQRELRIQIRPIADMRLDGWVTADTHVHFLSPSTAILEGQAEGLNLINLLASQWGDLFSNVGDVSQGPLTSPDGETMVWVGTENRQHLLGHLSLLGGRGEPVYPMAAAGPQESGIGDPLWSSLSEWADACRKREGVVVAPHFPYPTAELAADIVLDKIDAVELWPREISEYFDHLRFLEYYRYLNCGYRLPAVGGTDKMGATVAVGANRTYAWLDQDEFTFSNWARAIRRGNTFLTSGPLLLFHVDGHAPGEEIRIGAGGGSLEVQAVVTSVVPIHRIEVVMNGRVVASREERTGATRIVLSDTVRAHGAGWLAVRCASSHEGSKFRVAAHSSPVYLVVPGQELFSAPVATYLLTLIEGAQTWTAKLATRPDPERFRRLLKVFDDARERLHQRLHQHGIPYNVHQHVHTRAT